MNSAVLPRLDRARCPCSQVEYGPGWSLLQADSLEFLPELASGSVDLVFADPPYGLSNGGTTCRSGRRAPVDKGVWDTSHGLEVDHEFHLKWLAECQRILKPTGTLWVSGTQHVIFSIGYALQELGYHLLNTITWFKPNAAPNLACRFFTHSTELVLWASPARATRLAHRFNYRAMKAENGGKQMRDLWAIAEEPRRDGRHLVWPISTPGAAEKRHGRHPTQKPLGLLRRVLAASSVPGDLVLDPFCGSGTTGVAAAESGRQFIGVEKASEHYELALRRLREIAPSSEGR